MEFQRQGSLRAANRFAHRAHRIPRRNNHVLVSSARRLPQGAAGAPLIEATR